ncbi:type IVB pilus formation R64 PilN family outer membrane protein [Natronocella acetinitrilica]|uniref:Type IVB pilus formation R64 PilN family outer membrane protein n=1 Tax=Natronocella acetinitrilica TaxID=414046 RepID=A0AAE3KBY3_9GAMM|nr:hypothetical protein [Natronocella acetinitrilica]MCP1674268.1 type IVB pilus formation R64 PilN family outer membrane protein [Natronocella acetinitrilica]
MTIRCKAVTSALALAAIAASGCSTTGMDRADREIASRSAEVSRDMAQGRELRRSSVEVSDSVFFSATPFKIEERDRLPGFFSEAAPFRQVEPVSFQEIIGEIGDAKGIRIELSEDAIATLRGMTPEQIEAVNPAGTDGIGSAMNDLERSMGDNFLAPPVSEIPRLPGERGLAGSEVKMTIDHRGNLAGLLDRITSRANLYWRWNHDHVTIFRHDHRVYTVDILPGTSSFTSQVQAAVGPGASGGTSQLGNQASVVTINPPNQYESIREAIESLLSETGSFSLSEKTGMLTVNDTPMVQAKVERYIKQTNAEATQRIAVRTEIYDIVLNDQGSAGLDWDALYRGSSRVSGNIASSFTSPAEALLGLELTRAGSGWEGSQAFISMLREYADVSLVTTSTSYTTNGEAVPVQVVDSQAYLASVSSSVDEGGTRSYTLETGVTSSGITMNVLPRRLSTGKIMMQMAMDMRQLNNLATFQAGDTQIQLPEESNKNFLQRVVLDSGQPLMISGFERTENTSNTRSFGARTIWPFGGSRSGGERRIMTMIVITPYVISD